MKKVLVFGYSFPIGGIENYLLNLREELKSEVDFSYIVEDEGADRASKADPSFIIIPKARDSIKEYAKQLSSVLKSQRKDIDVFYANISNFKIENYIALRLALHYQYRIVVHAHAAMGNEIQGLLHKLIHSFILHRCGNIVSKASVKRLAVSEKAGQYLYQGKSFEVVVPGIWTDKFRFDDALRTAYREKLSLTDCIVLGFAGRLVSVKNPLFLIDILSELKARGQNARLLVLGDGDLKDEMLKKAAALKVSDLMTLTGAVSNVQDYMQAMDILLAPSFSEGLGMFVVEAQSSGLPCICAKGNIPESVNVTGEVVYEALQAGPKVWCDDIISVLSKSRDRVGMNEKAEKTDFNIKNSARRLLNSFK